MTEYESVMSRSIFYVNAFMTTSTAFKMIFGENTGKILILNIYT